MTELDPSFEVALTKVGVLIGGSTPDRAWFEESLKVSAARAVAFGRQVADDELQRILDDDDD